MNSKLMLLSTFLAGVFLLNNVALADGEGQDEYLKAVAAKAKAKTPREFDEVIDLCKSAIEKGLDDDTKKLAEDMIKNTLTQICVKLSDEVFDLAMQGQGTWRFKRRQALVRLEKLVELDEKLGNAHFRIARLQSMPGGDREKAKESLSKAIENGGMTSKEETQAVFMQAALADNDADREKALAEAIEKDPNNIEFRTVRAQYFLSKQKLDEAEADFEKLVELKPDDMSYKVALVEVLLMQPKESKLKKALNVTNQIIEDDKDNVELYLNRARIHGQLNDAESEIKDLSFVLEKEKGNILALLMRSYAYLSEDKIDEAKKDMEAILAINKLNALGIILQAQIAAQEKDFDLAVKNMKMVINGTRPSPQRVRYQLQLSSIYRQAERFNDALEIYSEILKRDPSNFDVILARATTVLGMGKHEQAIADYETAMELGTSLEPSQKELVWNNLAWVLATSPKDELRDGKRAVDLAIKAAELTEYKEAYILSTLASAYAEIGDFEKAIKWSTKAVEYAEKNPTRDSQVEDLKKELESYKKKEPWRELQEDKDKSGEEKKEKEKKDEDFDF